MKKVLLTLSLALLLAPATTMASDGAGLFMQKCGSCHKRGGSAASVNPADKAGVVWKKYFARGRHPEGLAAAINDTELQLVIEYLKEHAADSDQPATAVIPK
ncbi:c-type cytochrome [Thermodesulfobacteriota bacterium]